MLRILIESIPHKSQRYDTCGDWYSSLPLDAPPTLYVKVSELADRREMLLIAIHELIEAVLCESCGITQQDVDSFDLAWNSQESEPGECSLAPYYRQHQIATGFEHILAAEMGVDWSAYEKHLDEL